MIVDLQDRSLYTTSYFKIEKILQEPTRFKVVYGGSGSSKSFSYYQHLIIQLLEEKNHDFLILRKYGTTIEQSVFNGIKGIIQTWGLADYFTFTKRPYVITNNITGVKMLLMGVDDPEKLKSIVNIKRVLLEEATDFTFADFKEINRRVRGIEGIQIGLCFNPISHTHWIKKHFFDTPEINKNTSVVKCSYQDNEYLTQEDIDQLHQLKLIDEMDYKVYVLGEWGILTNRLIFKNWSECDSIPGEAKELPTGLDWGFANDPTAIVKVYKLENTLYLDEVCYETGLTNDVIAERLKQANIKNYIVADSAEPKSIQELRKHNLNVYAVKKYPGSIKDGIKLMKGYQIKVTSRSKNIITEFENYVYKVDKADNILPDPVDSYNDCIDAIRYVILMKNRLW